MAKDVSLFDKTFGDFPFREIFPTFDSFDFVPRVFPGQVLKNNSGALSVDEDEKEYVIKVETPGFDKDQINIELNDNVLTIKAERKDSEKSRGSYSERSSIISRRVQLSDEVDSEKIDAVLDKGILTLHLPKKEGITKQKIEITEK